MKERDQESIEYVSAVKEKNQRHLEEMPNADTIAMIDETNNTGSRTDGSQYVVGATVIDGSKKKSFSDITKKRWNGRELSFNGNPEIRREIIEEISENGPRMYAATVIIPEAGRPWSKKEQKIVHRNMLENVMMNIAEGEDGTIHMIIDENNKAKSDTVANITKRVGAHTGKDITSEVRRSENDFLLQTNDFAVGAMGRKYNHDDDRYTKRLPKIRKRMISQSKASHCDDKKTQ